MTWIKAILKLIALLLVQVLVFQNLHFMGICHPYVYILFLIIMPQLPRWAELLVGAAVGLLMDMICSSPGVHMGACVAMMFLRGILLQHFVQDAKRVTGEIDSLEIGRTEFIRLSVCSILCHHTLIFLLEAWGTTHLLWVLLTALVSSAVTISITLCFNALRHD